VPAHQTDWFPWSHHISGQSLLPATGTNLFGALALAEEMMRRHDKGSIVTMLCDSGERYLDTLYNDDWVTKNELNILPYLHQLVEFAEVEAR